MGRRTYVYDYFLVSIQMINNLLFMF